MSSLHGKAVIVTGSTTGIGEAIARRCVGCGARVLIHGLEEDLAARVAGELGPSAVPFAADLSDPRNAARVVDAALDAFGAVDALVNNAADNTRDDIESVSIDRYERLLAVNLTSPLMAIRRLVPHYRQRGGGVVLNIGSVNGLSGEPNLLSYSISKGGLMTLTRNLGNALGRHKVRVNQLNVGWTATEREVLRKVAEGFPEGWASSPMLPEVAPWGRLLTPEEVASHALFWISDESAPANGVVYELEQYPMIGRNLPK